MESLLQRGTPSYSAEGLVQTSTRGCLRRETNAAGLWKKGKGIVIRWKKRERPKPSGKAECHLPKKNVPFEKIVFLWGKRGELQSLWWNDRQGREGGVTPGKARPVGVCRVPGVTGLRLRNNSRSAAGNHLGRQTAGKKRKEKKKTKKKESRWLPGISKKDASLKENRGKKNSSGAMKLTGKVAHTLEAKTDSIRPTSILPNLYNDG